jgi:predicted TIM-barrel fold metal-dependent hydrolase
MKLICQIVIGVGLFWFATCQADVVDSHFHMVSPEGVPKMGFFTAPVDGKLAVEKLEEAGIDRVVGLSAAYLLNTEEDARYENNFVHTEAQNYPGKIIPFCSVRVGAEWAIREMKRCKNVLNVAGLKLHLAANQISLLNPEQRKLVSEIFQQANFLQLPILIDFNKWDTNEFVELYRLMFKNTNTKFILAHSLFTNYRSLALLVAAYKENPSLSQNIFVDVSATLIFFSQSPEEEMFLWYLRQLGLNKVFFGSDFPVFSPRETINALKSLQISESEYKGIAGNNFLRFIRVIPKVIQ